MSKERSYCLSQNFINSLLNVKKEDYRQIDAQLEEMSAGAIDDLFKMQIEEKNSKSKLAV